MKKVVLSISVMLVSIVAFAQGNESSVGQIGVANMAMVTQDGKQNESDVIQFGALNLVQVNQDGKKNEYSTVIKW
jgi:hypothetical protein